MFVGLINEITVEQEELLKKENEAKRQQFLRRQEQKRRQEYINSTIDLLRRSRNSSNKDGPELNSIDAIDDENFNEDEFDNDAFPGNENVIMRSKSGGYIDDGRTDALGRLAAHRRGRDNSSSPATSSSRPASPTSGKDVSIHSSTDRYVLDINVSVDNKKGAGHNLPSGRVRPSTAGAVRNIAADGVAAYQEGTSFAKYVQALPEFNSSTESSTSKLPTNNNLDDVNNISAVNSVTHVLGSKFKRPQTATIVRRERSASAWAAGPAQ
jgi:hypothetical protein